MAVATPRYFGLEKQAVYETYVAVTEYIDIISEELKEENQMILPETGAGYDPRIGLPGGFKASGSLEWYPTPENLGLPLVGMLGAPSTAGVGDPYTHTFLSSEDPLYLSGEVGTLVAVGAKKLTGMACTKMEIEVEAGELAVAKLDFFVKKSEQVALGTPTFPTDPPFQYHKADLDAGGGSIKAFVSACKLAIERSFPDDEYSLGDRLLTYAFPEALKISGEVDLYFEALTEWKRFYDGTTGTAPGAVVAPFVVDLELLGVDATSKVNFEMGDVFWNTHEANLDRRSRTMEKVEFVAMYDVTNAAALKVDLMNSIATY